MIYIRFSKLHLNKTLQKDLFCRNYIHLYNITCPMKGQMRSFWASSAQNTADIYLALAVLIQLLLIYAAEISACWVILASTVGTWHRGRGEEGGEGGGGEGLLIYVPRFVFSREGM